MSFGKVLVLISSDELSISVVQSHCFAHNEAISCGGDYTSLIFDAFDSSISCAVTVQLQREKCFTI